MTTDIMLLNDRIDLIGDRVIIKGNVLIEGTIEEPLKVTDVLIIEKTTIAGPSFGDRQLPSESVVEKLEGLGTAGLPHTLPGLSPQDRKLDRVGRPYSTSHPALVTTVTEQSLVQILKELTSRLATLEQRVEGMTKTKT